MRINTFSNAEQGQVFEINDSGTGVLEEDKARIFDPFFTRKPEGTGMGLSISRQIAEKHGALMELESAPGKGTTFRLIFPGGNGGRSLPGIRNKYPPRQSRAARAAGP